LTTGAIATLGFTTTFLLAFLATHIDFLLATLSHFSNPEKILKRLKEKISGQDNQKGHREYFTNEFSLGASLSAIERPGYFSQ
jgi:hypothetical protein